MPVFLIQAISSDLPEITKGPSVNENKITSQVNGTRPINFQWYRDDEEVSDGDDYEGCTTHELDIVGADPQARNYKCQLNNKFGNVFSKGILYGRSYTILLPVSQCFCYYHFLGPLVKALKLKG